MKAASGLRRQAVASTHTTRSLSTSTLCGATRLAHTSRGAHSNSRHIPTRASIRAYTIPPELDAARTHKGDAVAELEMVDDRMTHAGAEVHEDARSSPLKEYQGLVDRGVLRPDDYQVKIVQKLQDLHDELANYTPAASRKSPSSEGGLGLFSRFFHSGSPAPAPSQPPLGLYLYGDVGTGKTMLMDLFFKTLPPNIKKKRRVHFHAFMIDVHKRIHAMKQRLGPEGGDSIAPVGRELARDASVLCFDEFQVTDIADAMVLRRLLETLLDEGVVMVITSNRHPDQLYRNGINRDSFIPAIDLLKTEFSVTDLDSGTDYRRIPRSLSNVYYSPLDDSTQAEIHKLFEGLTRDQQVVEGRTLDIWGRKLSVPKSSEHVAMFDFNSLCGKPLSAADYLEITRNFGTVFLVDVKKMGLGEKDKARRFITFIDACYESKTKLLVSSEVPIYQIFADDKAGKDGVSDHMRSVMDDLGLSADVVGASSMFSGEEEVFAFARCCSRLVQMGSKEWAETAGHAGY